jgi:hypothetical protein
MLKHKLSADAHNAVQAVQFPPKKVIIHYDRESTKYPVSIQV